MKLVPGMKFIAVTDRIHGRKRLPLSVLGLWKARYAEGGARPIKVGGVYALCWTEAGSVDIEARLLLNPRRYRLQEASS